MVAATAENVFGGPQPLAPWYTVRGVAKCEHGLSSGGDGGFNLSGGGGSGVRRLGVRL
ncbi:hypothetical protein HanIR_Chr02g0083371 [Helianthus annuus]|nr:hypothetical protein HanIR_Chr02g0083361 [Helianthus annuus]KAJ0615800.1 hypothetical protein HanIR_Chr02g0083371 [Helianthus annuus]